MIDIHSIYHQPLSNYAFSIDEDTLIFRLKTKRNNLDTVNFCYGDTAYRGNPVQMTKVKMAVFLQDEYFDYYEVILKNTYKRIVYYFELHKDTDIKYYYGDLFYNTLSTERNDLFKLPFHRKDDIIDIPNWLKKASIYNIFPDSFTSSSAKQTTTNMEYTIGDNLIKCKLGGNLQNIINNLEYIKSLGFNTVYLNPIFMAGEYHKYDTIDYYRIDPCFGTNQDFKELVDHIHKKNMKIIIDGVFNHSGWNFFAFNDVCKNGENSIYKDWFYNLEFPVIKPNNPEDKPNYSCFGYERLMPKLNTSNPEVIEYFMDVVRYWTKNYQIDGWRLDVADEVDSNFWRVFRKTVKDINPDVALIGEVWQSAKYFLDGSMFDSTMNYSFLKHSKDFFALRTITSEQFNTKIVSLLTRYHENINYGQLNLLDSHDVPRFLSICNSELDKYELALVFLFTFVGVPMILYGDENAFTGIEENDYRRPMEFIEHPLKMLITKLNGIRNNIDCLQTGRFQTVKQSQTDGFYIYKRFSNKDEAVIILNVSNHKYLVDHYLSDYEIVLMKNLNHFELSPNGFLILKKKKKR